MGLRHRDYALVQRLLGGWQILRTLERLRGDRLDRRKRIFDPMIELVEKQPLQFLGLLALGEITARARDRDRLAVQAIAFELNDPPGAQPAPQR